MLKVMGNGVKCTVRQCQFCSQGRCILNTMTEADIITEECQTTDKWHITGSFVLDKVFGRTTARDIDLVMPQGEKPNKLPNEALESPLIIEMLWLSGYERHELKYHNISLPRITSEGFVNQDIAEELRANKTLSVLPGIRKLPAQIMFSAVKSIVKYDLRMDQRCLHVWNKSIVNPLAWRSLHLMFITYRYFESFDWDYEKVGYLIDRLERACKGNTEYEKSLYFNKLFEIMNQMDFEQDKGSLIFLQYVRDLARGNVQAQQSLKDLVHQRIKEGIKRA